MQIHVIDDKAAHAVFACSCIIKGSTSFAQAIDDDDNDQERRRQRRISDSNPDATCEHEDEIAVKPSALLEARCCTKFLLTLLFILLQCYFILQIFLLFIHCRL